MGFFVGGLVSSYITVVYFSHAEQRRKALKMAADRNGEPPAHLLDWVIGMYIFVLPDPAWLTRLQNSCPGPRSR